MKSVRCNKCKTEYVICKTLDKLGFPIGREKCENCGAIDYVVLEDDVKVKYNNNYTNVDNLDTINEDMRHTMAILKDEINELVETYINPWIK